MNGETVTGSAAWHDSLELLAQLDDSTNVVTLAVWAARMADANGDTAGAEEWATKAAQGTGRLF